MAAALLWALASVLFTRLGEKLRSVEINFLKGILALVLLTGTLFGLGEGLTTIPTLAFILLIISGAIGIGLGDTAYLQSLQQIGARRTLLLAMLAPPMTGVLAWIFLGETLPAAAWAGILVTILGVAWVISERTPNGSRSSVSLLKGIGFGLLAALAQSIGVILSRAALTQTSVSSLQSAILRLLAGVLLLFLWMKLSRQPVVTWRNFRQSRQLVGMILAATLIGTYLAIWLQQISIDLAPAGIAQTLLSTSPIFILPISALGGEKVSLRSILGALIAMAGIWLLFGGR